MDKLSLKSQLISFINQRYQSHAAKDLTDFVFANHLFHLVPVDAAHAEFAFDHKREVIEFLSDKSQVAGLVEHFVRSTMHYTYRRNQFINVTSPYDGQLKAEYSQFLSQFREALIQAHSAQVFQAALTTTLKSHLERLRLILSLYCLSHYRKSLEENPLLQTVPSDEYSARFQLELLAINFSGLTEPILDIGCGTAGALVNFLRKNGYEAWGVDRLAPAGPYFLQSDWFEFEYTPETWGAIIAHQSLSTHFIFNHLHNPDNAARFARLFMQIIASLKPGGEFHYAPGLPFFERHLVGMADYSIHRTPIPLDDQLSISDILYVAKIRRTE